MSVLEKLSPDKLQAFFNECENTKKNLPQGPWMHEAHRLEFKHKGLDCLLSRNPKMFHWCGYVGVPKGHPLFGKHYNDIDDVEVHGGLTFSSQCEGVICHTPKGADDDVWWLGWDAAHLYDLIPTMLKFSLEHKMTAFADVEKCIYKDVNFVTEQTISLADQLAKKSA